MNSMEAMKPFTKFMMVRKMYTKECLQSVYEHLSLLHKAGPILRLANKQQVCHMLMHSAPCYCLLHSSGRIGSSAT